MQTHKVIEEVDGSTIHFDNKDEWYFALWLNELYQINALTQWGYKEYTFKLFPAVKIKHEEQGKRKVIETELSLLQDAKYTPDFSFMTSGIISGFIDLALSTNIKNALFIGKKSLYHVDVKPSFNKNHSTAEAFSLKQKALWEKHGEYANKVVFKELFAKTFTPQRYLLTDKDMKPRKIGWKIKTVHEWIKEATNAV